MPTCNECSGTGWIETDAERIRCGCPNNARLMRELYRAGIGEFEAQDLTFGKFEKLSEEHGKALNAVRNWAGRYRVHNNGLWLHGDCGTGKTHLLHAALRSCVQKEYSGLYTFASNFLEAIKRGFDTGQAPAVEQKAVDVDVLVLDDIGAGKPSEWANDVLTRVLDDRCRQHKTVCVGTNIVPEKLAAAIGDRAVSRLHSMCFMLAMPTGDFRRRGPNGV